MSNTPTKCASAPPREGRDLFRLLVEQVKDYAIFGLDPDGIVISWNAGAERIKGYRSKDIIGHHFSRFYPEEAVRTGWPQTELEMATRLGRFEDEGWRVRKDGTRFWANVVITALHDEDGTLRGFAKVTRDLSEHQRAQRLEADARQMSEFVAMLAHELRNPLAPIRNAASLAQRHPEDLERTRWALGIIERQSAHLTRLVDDLLDVSRITRGRIHLKRRRIALGEAVATAVEAQRPACEQKGHTLTVDIQGDALVRGDLVRLTQVLSNLIGNACKYTPRSGRIEVVLSIQDQTARIAVRDTGVGIPPDLLPRIFEIFIQHDQSLERAEGGLGLGLAISRRLVQMHGGEITAASAGPGCGAEFVVTLPIVQAIEPGTVSRQDQRGGLVVLVGDDDIDAAESLQALLEANGHRALVAGDGDSALDQAKAALPDVIVLDIGLPGLNGYELAHAIRSVPALEAVLLVAITGDDGKRDQRRAADAGFDVHVAKPVDFGELVRRVPMLAAANGADDRTRTDSGAPG